MGSLLTQWTVSSGKLHKQCLRGGHARSLHLELLLGGAKHLNFISPPRPNTSVCLIPYFQSPFIRGVIIIMGLWYSNSLHHLWCCIPSCYTINNACTCRLCGERQPTKFHLLSCRTSTLARHIFITPVNVNKVVNILYVI